MAKNFQDKDYGYEELSKRFKNGSGHQVKVGILRDSGKHDGSDLTVAHIAAIHEFGAPNANIPERSFMRATMDEKSSEIAALAKKLMRGVVEGKSSETTALGLLGAFIQSLFRAKINSGLKPPLKPATISRKGSSKPLIDTGQLINSIDFEVE